MRRSRANTYATFRARVAGNINSGGRVRRQPASGQRGHLARGWIRPTKYGILTDANLNGKTTVAQVQALFTAEDPSLPLTYALSLPN